MQTITLEFKKLDRLPVPTSLAETLYEKTETGQIYQSQVLYDPIDGYYFDLPHILHSNTYAHVKVTDTQTDFKVGDRVTSKAYPHIQGKILHLNFETALVYDYSENYVLDLTDLTLITE
jgi:hypothetical protein